MYFTFSLALVFAVSLNNYVTINSFRAYDCFSHDSNYTTIALNHIAPCLELNDNDVHVSEVQLQIIQEKLWETYHVYHCNVITQTLITHCGMHSHASVVRSGFANTILDVDRKTCMDLHDTGIIIINGYKFVGNIGNTTNQHVATASGKLGSDGSCIGSSYSTPFGSYTDVVVQMSATISLKDYDTMFEISTSSFTFNDGTVCPSGQNKCIHPTFGPTFWTVSSSSSCGPKSRDVLYEGVATIAGPKSDIQIGDTVTVNSGTSLFSLIIKVVSHICHQRAYATDHERVYVILRESFGYYFVQSSIHARNIDFTMYMNSKISFTQSYTENMIKKVYKDLSRRDCEIERIALKNKLAIVRNHPQAFGHIVTGEPGYYVVVSGEVAHMMQCVAVDVTVRITDKCTKFLPVTYNNISLYMEPIARILTNTSQEVPCSPITPPMYEVNEKWYTFSPNPSMAMKPDIVQPKIGANPFKFHSLRDLLTSGLYAKDTMDKFKAFMTFPLVKMDSGNYIASKLTNSEMYMDNKYDPSFMISHQAIKDKVHHYLSSLFGGFLQFGSFFGAVIGVVFIYKVGSKILSIIINTLSLTRMYGCGIHIFASLLDSATHMVFAFKKPKETTSESTETSSDEPTDKTKLTPTHQVAIPVKDDGWLPQTSQVNTQPSAPTTSTGHYPSISQFQ